MSRTRNNNNRNLSKTIGQSLSGVGLSRGKEKDHKVPPPTETVILRQNSVPSEVTPIVPTIFKHPYPPVPRREMMDNNDDSDDDRDDDSSDRHEFIVTAPAI